MAHKFVINDGDLILGDVEFHEDLIRGRDRDKTVGGGRWHYDRVDDTIYFYGESVDFGQVTEQEFNDAFKQPSVENAKKIVFSNKMYMKDVLLEESQKNL